MLANLAPHKGQETAIRASATLKKAGVNIVLWLAGIERGGGDRYTTHLRSLASELGVSDRIHFLGHRNDAPELLRAADLFLLPSTREGLPLTILEAQATKVPVLAAPTGGIPEVVINDETGFLIASEDVAGYAKLIDSLLDNPDLGYRIVKQAYARVMKEYCWEVYSERIWELYRALMTPSYRTLHPKRKLL
jgi:glycosyltransferase involved in cell wall biosynthesis